jgi:rhamnosyltransferase
MAILSPQETSMPVCSIIIRAYNEEQHIGRLLEGICQQSVKDIQVILVDSGSTDATMDVAAHYGAEVVQIAPQDFTFGRSLNLGISHAKADKIVMASAHVYPVYPDWLERLLDPFKDPKVALTYGKQRGAVESQFSEQEIFRHWYPDHTDLHQAHPFCNNANAAIRRGLWGQHPYNENLPALEDLAWARWAHDQGLAIAYVAEAEIVHVHNETWKGITNRYRREGMAFKQIYPQENFYLWDLARLWVSNIASDWRSAAGKNVWGEYWWKVMRFRWMQFLGTYQGYHQSGTLTWKLKQAFYYPHVPAPAPAAKQRTVKPIQYTHSGTYDNDQR